MCALNSFICITCGKTYPLDSRDWRCACGGLFDLETWPAFDAAQIDPAQPGLWRYRRILPLEPAWDPVTLGEGNTPILPIEWAGQDLFFKLESASPTGSFKDRGASVLATALRGLGIGRVVDDSSGNAGASLAAVRRSGGMVLNVTELQIEQARNQLARLGFYVEGTSAVAVAAMAELPQAPASAPLVVLLTGHGLKTYRE
jgi:threonine synthase